MTDYTDVIFSSHYDMTCSDDHFSQMMQQFSEDLKAFYKAHPEEKALVDSIPF